MQRWVLISLLSVLTIIAACASRSTSPGAQPSDIVVLNGCKVDPARICHNSSGPDLNAYGGNWSSDPGFETSGTTSYELFVAKPDGKELFMIQCVVATSTRAVTGAHVLKGPRITDDDARFLRAADYCSEP
jgi:hypothetical protein